MQQSKERAALRCVQRTEEQQQGPSREWRRRAGILVCLNCKSHWDSKHEQSSTTVTVELNWHDQNQIHTIRRGGVHRSSLHVFSRFHASFWNSIDLESYKREGPQDTRGLPLKNRYTRLKDMTKDGHQSFLTGGILRSLCSRDCMRGGQAWPLCVTPSALAPAPGLQASVAALS